MGNMNMTGKRNRGRQYAWVTVIVLTAVVCTGQAADRMVGFRGDGSNVFSAEGVPTEWDVASGKNLVWATPLPERSFAGLVLVRDRIFLTGEPEWLLCLDATTGKELWKAKVSAWPEGANAARIEELIGVLLKQWRTRQPNPKDKSSPVGAAASELEKTHHVNALNYSLFGWQGYAYCTPFSDGQHVWARYGTGSMGCYDMNGNKVWVRRTPRESEFNVQSSQMLVHNGRVVLIEVIPSKEREGDKMYLLTGLDAATGEEVWRSNAFPAGNHSQASGLVLVMVEGKPFYAVSTGIIINPENGKIVGDGFGSWSYAVTTYARDGVLYWGAQRMRLKLDGDRVVTDDPMQGTEKTRDRVVYDQGVAYIAGDGFLQVMDYAQPPADLKRLPRVNYGFGAERTGERSVEPSIIGGLLYCPAQGGRLAVLKPGPTPELIKVNQFPDPICATPIGVGNRIFVRTDKALYCLGQND